MTQEVKAGRLTGTGKVEPGRRGGRRHRDLAGAAGGRAGGAAQGPTGALGGCAGSAQNAGGSTAAARLPSRRRGPVLLGWVRAAGNRRQRRRGCGTRRGQSAGRAPGGEEDARRPRRGQAASSEARRPGPRHSSHMASGGGAAFEELPPDGTCDECEPDEAPGAEEVCQECGFCYCRRHAEAHGQKFPRHHLAEYVHGAAQAWTPGARGDGAGEEEVEAQVENEKALESEAGEESESEEDCESEEESQTEEESEDESEEDSEEDSEEEMEDEQESEAEEDNQEEGESEAEGETEAESEFDPEIEMEAERVAKRKCPDHGLDLSTYCQEDKQLICVLCPVIGAHQGHQLSTLDEAFEELRVSIGHSEHRPGGQDTWVSTQGASLWPH